MLIKMKHRCVRCLMWCEIYGYLVSPAVHLQCHHRMFPWLFYTKPTKIHLLLLQRFSSFVFSLFYLSLFLRLCLFVCLSVDLYVRTHSLVFLFALTSHHRRTLNPQEVNIRLKTVTSAENHRHVPIPAQCKRRKRPPQHTPRIYYHIKKHTAQTSFPSAARPLRTTEKTMEDRTDGGSRGGGKYRDKGGGDRPDERVERKKRNVRKTK